MTLNQTWALWLWASALVLVLAVILPLTDGVRGMWSGVVTDAMGWFCVSHWAWLLTATTPCQRPPTVSR